MAKSILQVEKKCFLCDRESGLEEHHVFYGTANRKQSEKYGMKVWLCHECHTGNDGVHFNKAKDTYLKIYAQEKFDSVFGANTSFHSVFGKSYKEI